MRYRFLSEKATTVLPTAAVILLLIFTIASCYKEPVFPAEPSIEFAGIAKQIRLDQSTGGVKDSVTITIKFRDGNGDLGLNNQEVAEAVQLEQFNYVVTPLRKRRGVFTVFNPLIPYSGFFPRLKNDDRIGPIEGLLDYSIDFPNAFTPKKDSLQFQIYIVDRQGNRSNTVQTETIVLNEF